MKVHGAIVVTLTSVWALASHYKVLHLNFFFYIMGKALSGKLSCTGTGPVFSPTVSRSEMEITFLELVFLSMVG